MTAEFPYMRPDRTKADSLEYCPECKRPVVGPVGPVGPITTIALNHDFPTAIAFLKLTFDPFGKIEDRLPDGYNADARITDFDIEISGRLSLDEVHAARRNIAARSMSFFARLAALAHEDERLKALMDDYRIKVSHGERVLFESKES